MIPSYGSGFSKVFSFYWLDFLKVTTPINKLFPTWHSIQKHFIFDSSSYPLVPTHLLLAKSSLRFSEVFLNLGYFAHPFVSNLRISRNEKITFTSETGNFHNVLCCRCVILKAHCYKKWVVQFDKTCFFLCISTWTHRTLDTAELSHFLMTFFPIFSLKLFKFGKKIKSSWLHRNTRYILHYLTFRQVLT